jgi:hypothetical protein
VPFPGPVEERESRDGMGAGERNDNFLSLKKRKISNLPVFWSLFVLNTFLY